MPVRVNVLFSTLAEGLYSLDVGSVLFRPFFRWVRRAGYASQSTMTCSPCL